MPSFNLKTLRWGFAFVLIGILSLQVFPIVFPMDKLSTFDEESHVWLADQTGKHGAPFIKNFAKSFLKDDRLMKQVAPSRILVPLWLSWGHGKENQDSNFQLKVQDLRGRMILIKIAWLLLTAIICWKELGPKRGLLAYTLLACSPFWIGTSGRIWSDWLFNTLVTAAFWGSFRWWKSGRWGWLALVLTSLILADFTKETILLYYGGSFLALAWLTFSRKKTTEGVSLSKVPSVRMLWFVWLIGITIFTVWLTWLYGNPYIFIKRMDQVAEANKWAQNFSSGPWFRYFVDELLLNPIHFLFAIGVLLGINQSDYPKHWRIWFWSVWIGFSILPFKELRYIGHLDLPLAMAVTILVANWTQNRKFLLRIALIALLLWCSFFQTWRIFVKYPTYIGTTFELITSQKFVPSH
jgi:hypothetical protein